MVKLEFIEVTENTDINDGIVEGAELGAKVGGIIAVGAGGASAVTAAVDGAFGEQILNWGMGKLRGLGQKAKNIGKEGFQDWKDGVEEIGDHVKNGARQSENAWKDGVKEIGDHVKNGARQGANAWKDGAKNLGQRAREGYERFHPPAVQPIQVY